MSTVWGRLPRQQYGSLAPWCGVQLESGEAPGPFPFVAGIAPEVVAGLHEAHSLLSSSIDTAISDVFSKRAPLDDSDRQRRLEDAYAELVNSRPYLKQHIRCGRRPDGTFQWEFPTDPTKSATVANGGLRIFHSVKRQAIPIGFDQRLRREHDFHAGLCQVAREAEPVGGAHYVAAAADDFAQIDGRKP